MNSTRTRPARLALVSAAVVVISMGVAAPAGAAQIGENYPGGESTFKAECGMAGGTQAKPGHRHDLLSFRQRHGCRL